MFYRIALIGISCLLFIANNTICQTHTNEVLDGFEAHIFSGVDGTEMPYRLFIPEAYDSTTSYPIIMYLHGGGGAGDDNIKQITGGNTHGTHVWTTPEIQVKYPAFVVAPQLLGWSRWNDRDSIRLSNYGQLAIDLLITIIEEYRVDPDRVYLVGQSRGGYGTWDLAGKCPDLFAAAVPLCGRGNLYTVEAMKHLPVWAFHGAKDEVVPVQNSREIVSALQKIDAKIKYTEYPDAGHNIWDIAYFESELIDWLFSQNRKNRD